MNVDEIRQLVKIVEESEIADLEVTRWGQKIKISKYVSNSHPGMSYPGGPAYLKEPVYQHVVTPAPVPPQGALPPAAAPSLPEGAPAPAEAKNLVEIKSPMVGTFYRAPAPDAEPYASEGSMLAKGQVLCIIEAMKLMNEIEAEFSCRIVEILVQNAQPVEYNQPLFRVIKT